MEKLALSLRVPLADLYSAATFYHYFMVEGKPSLRKALCRGPVCSLPGIGSKNNQELPSISCPGLCDQPTAQFESGRFFSTASTGEGFRLPEPVQTEEAIFRSLRVPDPCTLESYRRNGGYEQLLKLARHGEAARALDLLQESALSGRGGAGFSLAAKWRAVRDAQATPKYVVCNADEGEPGTFKDRPILHLEPHLLLEAMAIAGRIVGAEAGVIYLRYEYPQALRVLSEAIEEAKGAGLLGKNILGTGFSFYVHVRRGAGSYVCGEETALLNSLEGLRPWPRERPPFPTTHGLWGKPTVINNVETLSSVPPILERGAEWFRSLGRGENAGSKIYSVSGKVQRTGNYELPLGITAKELIFDNAGGPPQGRKIKAFTLGGISGGLLCADHLDLALDYQAPQRLGTFLGSGGVIVLDDNCCVVDFVRSCMLFYESESCGKCSPCRIGTVRLREFLDGLTGRADLSQDSRSQMEAIGSAMVSTSACGLGQSAPLVVTGMFQFFAEEVDAHLKGRNCPAGVCRL
jgi:NADH:ubiquinone oxidoreductase subunit F (NADH-binding)